jgi:hypothetical protein
MNKIYKKDFHLIPYWFLFAVFYMFFWVIFLSGLLNISLPVSFTSNFWWILIFIFLVVFFFYFFTKKGRLSIVKINTGADEVISLGELNPQDARRDNAKRKRRLYKCLDKSNEFYVIEVTNNRYLKGFNRYYFELTPEELKRINQLVRLGKSNFN